MLAALSWSLAATAQAPSPTPTAVTTAVAEFEAARGAGKTLDAADAAHRAWQAAKASLGESTMTGDLAYTYARLPAQARGVPFTVKDEAYRAAIGQAEADGDLATGVDRRLRHAEFRASFPELDYVGTVAVKRSDARRELKALDTAIAKAGLRGSTAHAQSKVVWAKYYNSVDKHRSAVEAANAALSLYKAAPDDSRRMVPFNARLMKAWSQRALGQHVEAALTLTRALEYGEARGLDDHVAGHALNVLLETYGDLRRQGRYDKAVARGMREVSGPNLEGLFWEDGTDRPVYQVPPTMPPTAERSGWVRVVYDIGLDGRPTNLRRRGATDDVYVPAAARSVRRWLYGTKGWTEPKRDVETVISFRLADETGALIPPPRPFPSDGPGG